MASTSFTGARSHGRRPNWRLLSALAINALLWVGAFAAIQTAAYLIAG